MKSVASGCPTKDHSLSTPMQDVRIHDISSNFRDLEKISSQETEKHISASRILQNQRCSPVEIAGIGIPIEGKGFCCNIFSVAHRAIFPPAHKTYGIILTLIAVRQVAFRRCCGVTLIKRDERSS